MVQELDGSKNEWGWSKSKLGANAILAVSLAYARASAHEVTSNLYPSKTSPSTNTWLKSAEKTQTGSSFLSQLSMSSMEAVMLVTN